MGAVCQDKAVALALGGGARQNPLLPLRALRLI